MYQEKGCQITDGATKDILSEIENYGYFDEIHPYKSIIEVFDDTIPRKYLFISFFAPFCLFFSGYVLTFAVSHDKMEIYKITAHSFDF